MVESAMAPPILPEASKEIEFVKGLVAKQFPVYDVRVSYDVVEFFVRVDETTLEDNFERLREDMGQHGFIPMIAYDKGEHIVTVAKKPTVRYRSIYVNGAMLVITFLTMLLAGTFDWAGYAGVDGSAVFSGENLLMGMLTFALPLMAILGVHELGHYFMARRRNVAASLPFFIPSIPPLGTFGAFISLRDPIPNKKSLLEIGVAGPLAGLLVALPLGVLGLMLTNDGAKAVPVNVGSEGVMAVSFPLIYTWIEQFLVPIQGDYLLHPTAFAAWVGFLVTALNLLPVGQLDGGHIARALMGVKAKYLTWVTIAAMVAIGFVYFGWLLFALLILFLGARHPPPLNDISKLDVKRKGVGIFAFVVLVIAFVPIPISPISADYSFDLAPLENTNASIAQGEAQRFTLLVDNVGNALNEIDLSKASSPFGWTAYFKNRSMNDTGYAVDYSLRLNAGETAQLDVLITSYAEAQFGESYTVIIKGKSKNSTEEKFVLYNLTVTSPTFSYWVQDEGLTIPRDSQANVPIQVNNTNPVEANLTFVADGNTVPPSMYVLLFTTDITDPNVTRHVSVVVPGDGNSTFSINIFVGSLASTGEKTIPIEVYYNESLLTTITVTFQVT